MNHDGIFWLKMNGQKVLNFEDIPREDVLFNRFFFVEACNLDPGFDHSRSHFLHPSFDSHSFVCEYQ